jgi:ABC-2 type transport system permease protein
MRRRGRRIPLVVILGARNLTKSIRTPMLITVSLLQPIIWLVLFSQTFRGLANTAQFRSRGYDSYLAFLTPGMIVLSALFSALQSGLATVTDIDTGMMDKLTSSPIRRVTILGGRAVADATTMLAQAVIVLVVALALGARFRDGWAGALLLLALTTLFGLVWASLANLIALRTRNSELTMVLGLFLTLPVLFLSPAFFPLSLQPRWLQKVAAANPASYVITTGQQLMSTGNSWAQDGRTLLALGITAAAFVPAAIRAFRSVTR